MLTISEMEILKAALEGDIIRQRKFLQEMADDDSSDIRFEMWLEQSEQLLKKVSLKLIKMQANS